MAELIVMPKMNLTMEEGYLAFWYKCVGDTVKVDEPICSVENAKETEDMLSLSVGTILKIIGEEGAVYPVAAPIAVIGNPGEDISALLAQIEAKPLQPDLSRVAIVEGKPAVVADESLTNVKMMPKVRNLVKELSIDLNALVGYCDGRKITEEEVLAYSSSLSATNSPEVMAGDKREKMSSMRKSIAKNMAESCEKTARLTNFMEVDATDALTLVKQWKEEGKKLSVTALIIKACALALREHKIINTVLNEAAGEIIYKGDINISCAVNMPGGLAVPVIQKADDKCLTDITAEIADFSSRTQAGKLKNEEMANGTFTVSNVGMLDVDFFTPIINYPQTAILGVGAVRTQPRYMDESCEKLSPRKIMIIGLTYDHRVIDGAPASVFLQSVKLLLQNPLNLL